MEPRRASACPAATAGAWPLSASWSESPPCPSAGRQGATANPPRQLAHKDVCTEMTCWRCHAGLHPALQEVWPPQPPAPQGRGEIRPSNL